ncbi:MAG: hypothetical protein C0617_16185 [Desulfuromonas sp.]|uniref:DUF3343 domain-containing protein n=1 Tax=Desulfuromonas sp. TaxID=892 RepID=UPI000CC04156|nr:MAG: hypothetical protein C0617_16185 [Desulfuromonas sp.]
MVQEHDIVAIFNSIHRVMKAEKALKLARVEILLIPVPRQLSSDCGLAIRFASEDRRRVEEVLTREGIGQADYFRREGEGFGPA